MNKKSLINQINHNVKSPKNVIIKSLETIETMGISKVPNHENVLMSLLNLHLLIDKGMRFMQYQVIIF